MKFLCPSCKAKYQIADEKVAGRSVRMKCRKCGFVIPISEIPPAPETMPPDEAGWDVKPPVVPKAPGSPVVGAPPSAAVPPSAASPASPAPAPVSPPPASAPVSPSAKVAPAVSRAAPVPKPAAKPASAAGSAGAPSVAAKPPVVRPAAAGTPVPRVQTNPAATTKAPTPKPSTAGASPKPSPAAAVAAALGVAPAEPEAPPPAKAAAPATPVTPSPAGLTGNVDLLPAVEDGGDEDDDATRIVKGGALADAFGALVGSSPSGPPTELGMPADEWYVGINDVPVGPIRLGEIRKRALLGAITLDSMVWRDGFEAWRPLKTFPELVAVLEESMSSVRASSAPLIRPAAGSPPPGKATEPDSLAGASSGITGTAVVTDDYAAAGLTPGRSPIFAWLAIIVALGCGLTIGFVVWSKQKPPETIVKYVEVPAKSQAPAAAAIQDSQATTAGPATSGTAPKTRSGSKSSGIGKTPDVGADKGGGLSGLKGLSALGPSGPNVGNASPGSTPVGGGGQLDGAQTQATVARYTGSVKRSCWQPALDARTPDAPASARVTVSITVGGTGSVQGVTTSGDPRGYPGLANCIGARVRAWQFPATGGTTTVNVPFVFAAQ